MNVYYYCSYTGSPVGYILGGLKHNSGKTEDYNLSSDHIPQLIRKCFELGEIRKAFGSLPSNTGNSEYFLLIKKLIASGTGEEESSEYYINFALTTTDEAEYHRWLQKGDETEQDIIRQIKKTMNLDRTNDFGFTVRPKELDQLLKFSFGSLIGEDRETNRGEINFELASSQTELDDLKSMLKLSDSEKELRWKSTKSEKWVCYGKKKVLEVKKGVILAALIITVVIAALCIKMMGITETNLFQK